MGLFQRLSQVVKAEINYVKSQSTNPEEEIDRAIRILQDAVTKTRLALIAAPTEHADTLKRNLIGLETKLTNAQMKRTELVARIKQAKANEQLQNAVGRLGASTAMGAYERMEEAVLRMEASSQAAYELMGNDLEQQFALLESGSDVDDELAAMKAQLLGSSLPQQSSLDPEEKTTSSSDLAVELELEALRKQLDNI